MKASKQRKMMKAIVSNKALKGVEAKRLTDMQSVVMSNFGMSKQLKKAYADFNSHRMGGLIAG